MRLPLFRGLFSRQRALRSNLTNCKLKISGNLTGGDAVDALWFWCWCRRWSGCRSRRYVSVNLASDFLDVGCANGIDPVSKSRHARLAWKTWRIPLRSVFKWFRLALKFKAIACFHVVPTILLHSVQGIFERVGVRYGVGFFNNKSVKGVIQVFRSRKVFMGDQESNRGARQSGEECNYYCERGFVHGHELATVA